jgi:TolB-like protein/DNA-binding winged helix-turn-helix (wHTH) protein/Flp pilus assembly protein TadD
VLSAPTRGQCIRFAFFEVDLGAGELRRHGYRIKLQEKPLLILAALLDRPGEVMTREELHRLLWPDNTFVDFDHNLNNAINKLRDSLNDSADKPRFIETLPRRGYRFLAEVEIVRNGAKPESAPLATLEAVRVPAVKETDVGTALPPLPAASVNSATRAGSLRALLLFAFVLISASGLFLVMNWKASPQTLPPHVRLAVLPFKNLTGDADQEYICDGMTEELIAHLGNLDPDNFAVIARTTSMHYKGTLSTITEIGHDLGVDYVLESSIRRVDSHIRVTTRLIEVREQRHVWAESFDQSSSDILGLQERISSAVADEIPRHLSTLRISRVHSSRPANQEAYSDYLRGRYFWNKRNREGLEKGVSYFKKAIKEDPGYALAFAGLADSYLVLGGGYLPPHQTYQQGEAAAGAALALDNDLAAAHTSLAYFKFIDEWDWTGAEREFKRAIALDPGYATAHHWYALYLSAMGREQDAIFEIEKALELDPFSTVINSNAGAIYYQAGAYEKSVNQLHRTLELDSNFVPAHGYLGYIYEMRANYVDALAEYQKAQQISGERLAYAGDVGRVYALIGRKAEAQTILQQLRDTSKKHSDVSDYSLCLIYDSLGDPDRAFTWLRKSIEDREFTATELRYDRRIDDLRADPRFTEIRRPFNIPNPRSREN